MEYFIYKTKLPCWPEWYSMTASLCFQDGVQTRFHRGVSGSSHFMRYLRRSRLARCSCTMPFPNTDKFCPGYSICRNCYKKTTYPNPWSRATDFPTFSFIEFGYENPGGEPAHVLDTFWFFLSYFFDLIVWNWIPRCNVVLSVWFCRIHRLVLSGFFIYIG